MMEDIEKMNLAIDYYIGQEFGPDLTDPETGGKISLGMRLEDVKDVRHLTFLLGKAQVYKDKRDAENYDTVSTAFWNYFEDDLFKSKTDLDDYIDTFHS